MEVRIIAVGNIKEGYLRQAAGEYQKRLAPYCRLEIVEVGEERLPQQPSEAEVRQALEKEGQRIIHSLPKRSLVVPLCIEGKTMDSLHFAGQVKQWEEEGGSHLTFVIGSSYGLSPAIKKSGPALSFSPMTFPHQLMRIILLEQLYRAFRILSHEPYHK